MNEQTTSVAESAKNMASQAGDKLLNTMEQQKAAGADFVSGMAGAMRRAASEFGDVPQAAQYIRLAADQIDTVSDAFRRRDLNQLVADVQDFAPATHRLYGCGRARRFCGHALPQDLNGEPGCAFVRWASKPCRSGLGTGSQPMGAHVSPSSSANWPSRGTGMS